MIAGTSGSRGLFRNDLTAGNAWVNIRLAGVNSNRSAIGAKVRARAVIGGVPVWQVREVSSQNSFDGMNMLNVHFGFGNATMIDSLKIEWPRGLQQEFTNVAVNNLYTVTEGGGIVLVGVDEGHGQRQLPQTFLLKQNYPNPFNPSTTIRYELDRQSVVVITVHNQLGQEIRRLVDGEVEPGDHAVVWDGLNSYGLTAASGMYYIRARAGSFSGTIKVALTR